SWQSTGLTCRGPLVGAQHRPPSIQKRGRWPGAGTGMLDRDLLAFAVVAGVITVIPGVDMALVTRKVLAHGRRAGYVTSVGVCTGLWVHAVASAVGLSAILMASAALFSAVKLAGALYLVTLGVASLGRAIRPAPSEPRSATSPLAGDARR